MSFGLMLHFYVFLLVPIIHATPDVLLSPSFPLLLPPLFYKFHSPSQLPRTKTAHQVIYYFRPLTRPVYKSLVFARRSFFFSLPLSPREEKGKPRTKGHNLLSTFKFENLVCSQALEYLDIFPIEIPR